MTLTTSMIAIALVFIYFLPTFIAYKRNHRNFGSILLLNLFLGWTGIGCIVAFIWSFIGDTKNHQIVS